SQSTMLDSTLICADPCDALPRGQSQISKCLDLGVATRVASDEHDLVVTHRNLPRGLQRGLTACGREFFLELAQRFVESCSPVGLADTHDVLDDLDNASEHLSVAKRCAQPPRVIEKQHL